MASLASCSRGTMRSICAACRTTALRRLPGRSLSTLPQLSRSGLAPRPLPSAFSRLSPTPLSRRFAQTLGSPTAPSGSAPQAHTIPGTPPDVQLMKADEFWADEEVRLVPPEQAVLRVTDDAVRQLARISNGEPPDSLLALRLAVESGGCHGYQYKIDLTGERGVDDYVFPTGQGGLPIVVDLVSLELLKGSTLHFATELIGSSFRLENNPQAKEGGACGCGVSWEAKEERV